MIKDILAVVEDPEKAAPIVNAAIAFAEQHGAHLEIAVLTPGPVISPALVPLGGLYVPDSVLERDAKADVGAVEILAARATCPVSVFSLRDDVAWLAGDVRHMGEIADLIMMGTAATWDLQWLRRRALEMLILASGTPILILPPERRLMQVRHAVLGWKPSAEATRAVHDLVAMVSPGALVDVVTIGARPPQDGERAGTEVRRHLIRHGLAPELHHLHEPDRSEAATLQAFTTQVSADLLVIGGFAHSRMREAVLGGVTRDVIGASYVPVLLSH